jgi:hypothetical protein
MECLPLTKGLAVTAEGSSGTVRDSAKIVFDRQSNDITSIFNECFNA